MDGSPVQFSSSFHTLAVAFLLTTLHEPPTHAITIFHFVDIHPIWMRLNKCIGIWLAHVYDSEYYDYESQIRNILISCERASVWEFKLNELTTSKCSFDSSLFVYKAQTSMKFMWIRLARRPSGFIIFFFSSTPPRRPTLHSSTHFSLFIHSPRRQN